MWRLGVFIGSIALLIQAAFPPWHSTNGIVRYEWAFTDVIPGEIYCGRLLCQAIFTIAATALMAMFWENLDSPAAELNKARPNPSQVNGVEKSA